MVAANNTRSDIIWHAIRNRTMAQLSTPAMWLVVLQNSWQNIIWRPIKSVCINDFLFLCTNFYCCHISSVNVNLHKISNKQNNPNDPFPHKKFISLSFPLYFRSLNKSTFWPWITRERNLVFVYLISIFQDYAPGEHGNNTSATTPNVRWQGKFQYSIYRITFDCERHIALISDIRAAGIWCSHIFRHAWKMWLYHSICCGTNRHLRWVIKHGWIEPTVWRYLCLQRRVALTSSSVSSGSTHFFSHQLGEYQWKQIKYHPMAVEVIDLPFTTQKNIVPWPNNA